MVREEQHLGGFSQLTENPKTSFCSQIVKVNKKIVG